MTKQRCHMAVSAKSDPKASGTDLRPERRRILLTMPYYWRLFPCEMPPAGTTYLKRQD